MESSKTNIKPYISKRKRKIEAESDSRSSFQKRNSNEEDYLKGLFITDSTVLCYINSRQINHCPKTVMKSVAVCQSPLWSVQWCPKFSHLIGSTAELSLKLYDTMKYEKPVCVHTSTHHDGFLRDLDWARLSKQVATCAFDKTLKICDFMCGGVISQSVNLPEIPTVVRWNPENDSEILIGGHKGFLSCYDLRTGTSVRSYSSQCGNVISFDFFPDGERIIAAGDAVSKQSPEHGLIVWDVRTGAKLSSQIYHERYSCPCVRVHPSGSMFLAQTNGNYIARFSSQKPFRLDKYMRYESHRVEGYPVGFDFSPDGTIVASGSCEGRIVCYKYTSGSSLRELSLPRKDKEVGSDFNSPVCVKWHPVLPSVIAVTDWHGSLHIVK